jgi:hypothetical protein
MNTLRGVEALYTLTTSLDVSGQLHAPAVLLPPPLEQATMYPLIAAGCDQIYKGLIILVIFINQDVSNGHL